LCYTSEQNAHFVMLGSRGKRGVEQQMVRLQQQTLSAVNALVDIHRQLLEVKKAKLELKREHVWIEKIKLATKGWVQDTDGNWVAPVKIREE